MDINSDPHRQRDNEENKLPAMAEAASAAGSSKTPPFSTTEPPSAEEKQEQGGKMVGAGSSATKVKLRIPKLADEIKEPGQFSHICKECGKGFSSGKALGGHMSSAHVQAKEKLKSRKSGSFLDGDSDDEKHVCGICFKEFPSSKSLYGHMRLHPERQWRGMQPPHPPKEAPLSGTAAARQLVNVEDLMDGQDFSEEEEEEGFDEDSGDDMGRAEYDLADLLGRGWGLTGRRGQKAGMLLEDWFGFADEDEKERVIDAATELIRLANGPPLTQENDVISTDSFTPSAESARYGDLPITNKKLNQLGIPSSDDSEETLICNVRFANVPINSLDAGDGKGKSPMVDDANSLDAGGAGRKRKFGELDGKVATAEPGISPEKHKCITCDKIFPTHQALGGHRSSHNKVKIQVQNAADQPEEFRGPTPRLLELNGAGAGAGFLSDVLKVVSTEMTSAHECELCGKRFQTGQALGGHKRRHYTGGGSTSATQSLSPQDGTVGEKPEKKIHEFDLNVALQDDDQDLN